MSKDDDLSTIQFMAAILLALGYAYGDICRRLSISPQTLSVWEEGAGFPIMLHAAQRLVHLSYETSDKATCLESIMELLGKAGFFE